MLNEEEELAFFCCLGRHVRQTSGLAEIRELTELLSHFKTNQNRYDVKASVHSISIGRSVGRERRGRGSRQGFL